MPRTVGPAENQETNTYPTAAVVVSMFVPSIIDAKFHSAEMQNPRDPSL